VSRFRVALSGEALTASLKKLGVPLSVGETWQQGLAVSIAMLVHAPAKGRSSRNPSDCLQSSGIVFTVEQHLWATVSPNPRLRVCEKLGSTREYLVTISSSVVRPLGQATNAKAPNGATACPRLRISRRD